jgi:nicotinamidase-related amidase
MARSALIVIDMLNDYRHEDSEPLRESVRQVLPVMADLIARARKADVLVAYVNDNHGDWTAGRSALSKRALEGADPALVEPIVPDGNTPFLVKARHSIFYATQLEYMLRQFEVDYLVLVGQVTEQCVLYSALDAYIRHFRIAVPRNAVAHIDPGLADAAFKMMEINMRADIIDAQGALRTLIADQRHESRDGESSGNARQMGSPAAR